ncbi:hypothetical protein MGMO_8c00770 [Methyloglobulus morosus KoM1]|uniref:Uncharacterized protein n=1 Tax=Methyloglobulus morosus KoM1 TaxID=1116472 RepID=V5BKT7_9GAMM|nr:hypothetical protein [Methyloglobulus morosus]ESS73940.1 hypothetical protein MGMO_8c00770 [Methyloglobulus morosus KoM1]
MLFSGNKILKSRIEEAVKIVDLMTDGELIGHIDTSGNDPVVPLMQALKKKPLR